MPKIIHAQTVMFDTELKELKEKTKEPNTKDALYAAVKAYLGK